MLLQLAQLTFPSLSLGQLLIAIVVIAAACAIVFIAVRAMGLEIPGWVVQMFWVIAIAFVAIFALRFVFSM